MFSQWATKSYSMIDLDEGSQADEHELFVHFTYFPEMPFHGLWQASMLWQKLMSLAMLNHGKLFSFLTLIDVC